MTTKELQERIARCEETIAKKTNTIAKRNKAIEKIVNNLHRLGYKGNTYEELSAEKEKEREINFNGEKFQEGYGYVFDLYEAMDSIKTNTKAIEAEKEKIAKYNKLLEVESKKNDLLDNLPENVIEFMKSIEDSWNYFDKSKRNRALELYKEYKAKDLDYYSPEYKEFHKMMKEKFGDYYELMRTTDEEIERTNKKLVKNLIIDFIDRVKFKVGEITSFGHLYLNKDNQGYCILNGYVEGTEDTAKVESIYAGGYNIQRLHVRVLVK